MIIDAQTIVGESLYNNGVKPKQLLKMMGEMKIDRAIICPAKPDDYNLSKANDYIVSVSNQYKNTFIGFARVDPNQKTSVLEDLDKYIGKGLKGIYLHPWEDNFQINDPIVFPIIQFGIERNVPIMVESGYPWVSHASQIMDLALNFKESRIIATNAAQLDLSGFSLFDVSTLMRSCKNIYLLTTSAVASSWLADLINNVSAERVIYASKYPQFDPRLEILRINFLNDVDEGRKQMVLSGNILKLVEN